MEQSPYTEMGHIVRGNLESNKKMILGQSETGMGTLTGEALLPQFYWPGVYTRLVNIT